MSEELPQETQKLEKEEENKKISIIEPYNEITDAITEEAVATKEPEIPDEQAEADEPSEEAPMELAQPSPEPEPMPVAASAPKAIPEPKKPKRGGWWQKITR